MIIVLTFQNPINESVQVGDTVFAISNFSSTGGFMHNNLTNAVEIGPITQLVNRDGADPNTPIEIHADHITLEILLCFLKIKQLIPLAW